ncbi:putative tRNA acetyltransferase SKDI_07G0330 [Saccharomyces kudriavzevii IFO 1802]|uniref:THUMP domain-containing protein n=1 Tax=Saccharomyces kudriavzevii (strain ATCC MYA-4449 / AS 2.2408 / CBS 8840 / NBRC 1802 / NCYC 2889) TaxID=226230 RepID=A0AA35JHI0_SACK1|nr:uncharacterized protein SKDI_07G0330 [Saccharomyces kudriavzevii IFO 1802]CAI4061374.1 hypothetical protein SKDI_07G0330 [Saccharomyces kudriavzevii IFO 1802]
MGEKRKPDDWNAKSQKKKKFKVSSGFLDPGTSGIYATCSRRHERQAAQELQLLFEEKLQQMYGDMKDGEGESGDNEEEEELSIEDQIKRELREIKGEDSSKDSSSGGMKRKDPLAFIDLNCECVTFCKTRKPIVPEEFVLDIMKDLADPKNMVKRTRYVQKLTPITYSCNAKMEQLIKLANLVIGPHFHDPSKVKTGYKFAVEVTRRNFNTIERMDIINQVVKLVNKEGSEFNHTVNLKDYDKLILVECFKSNIGMCVVDGDYKTKYRKYNVQQIYESKFQKNDGEDVK